MYSKKPPAGTYPYIYIYRKCFRKAKKQMNLTCGQGALGNRFAAFLFVKYIHLFLSKDAIRPDNCRILTIKRKYFNKY